MAHPQALLSRLGENVHNHFAVRRDRYAARFARVGQLFDLHSEKRRRRGFGPDELVGEEGDAR